MTCSFDAEESFGPAVALCWRTFDFSLFFEEVFFQVIPSFLFVVCSSLRLLGLVRRPVIVNQGGLHLVKLCTATVIAILQLISLVFTCVKRHETTSASIPASALSLIAALFLIILSHYEHTRLCRPSFLIGIYLCITTLLRSSTVRTYWSLDGGGTVASILLSALIVQLIMIVLESRTKRRYLSNSHQRFSREEMAGFYSRSLFMWLGGLMISGYRKPLEASDLQPIDKVLCSSDLKKAFDLQGTAVGYTGLPGKALRSLGLYLYAPIFPRLCVTAFTFSQPFLTTALISYLGDEASPSRNEGYGLIGATFLVYVGIAISNSWYWHLTYKSVTMIRGGLVESIFEKILKLKEDKESESKALTLTISDIQKITGTLTYMHEMWAGVLETALASWLLYRQLGASCFVILALALICTIISMYISNQSGPQQQIWFKAKEKRIAATRKMLSSLKAIKMVGASRQVGSAIELLRIREFEASKMFRTLMVGGVLSSYATLTLSPVLVFGVYIAATQAKTDNLDASRLFTSLILISLLASPLIRILQMVPSFGATKTCFSRLQTFLEKEERVYPREGRGNSFPDDPVSSGNSPSNEYEKSDKPAEASISGGGLVVSIRNADFGWALQPQLRNINLDIRKGEHIAITGPIGCGKSLLLRGILGETEAISGIVYVEQANIGYCSQIAWVENLTAEANAFRCAPDDEVWRRKVIDACALGNLLSSQGNNEMVGSGGVKLSGGERQRLTLARAIASQPAILLLDDIFSAIDRTTEKHIIRSLFGPGGLLRQLGTTVIQVIQDRPWSTMADRVFEIDTTGQLRSKVSYAETFINDEITSEHIHESSPETNANTSKLPEKKVESKSPKNTDRAVYGTYFGAVGPAHMIIFFVFGAIFAFCLKFPDIWVQWWSSASIGSSSKSTGYWIGLYTMLQITPLIALCIWLGHLMLQIVPISGIGLHRRLLKTVLGATFVFIINVDSGSLINRFNQDLSLVDLSLPLSLFNTAASFYTCIMQVVLVTVAAYYVTPIIPVLLAVLYLIQHFYLRTSKQLRLLDLESKAGIHTKISETYAGIVTIRAHHGLIEKFKEEFMEKLDRSQEPLYLLYMVQRWLQLTLNLVVAGLSITVTGVAIAMQRKTTAGAIGVAFLNMTTLGETLTNFITSWTSLETSLGAIFRIESFETDTPVDAEITSPVELSPHWPASGSIRFNNVWVSYDPNADSPQWGLRGITLEINAGDRIAVCGRSGSGKSTLVMSLLGLIPLQIGSISIDDFDIAEVDQSLLRSRCHVISQDAFIQGETIRDALDAEGTFSDQAINNILSDCSILDKINTSGGLSVQVSESNLSVGETQLFSLAQIILEAGVRPGGILLLDEATSSVDAVTEQKIMKLIAKRLPKKTVISVLHRLEAALEYPRILVLEEGQVTHFGTSTEVREKSNLFSALRK